MISLTSQQREFFQELFGNKRGIPFPQGNMLKQQIDLSVAQPPTRYDFAGDFLYCDRDTTGVIKVQYNSLAMPAFPFGSNTAINGFPYETVYLSWEAQTNLVANVWHGYGANIIPPNQDISQILSTVDVQEQGFDYATSFSSSSGLAANTPQNIIAAASNTAGYVLHNANWTFTFAAIPQVFSTLLAKTTAPTTATDGDILAAVKNANAVAGGSQHYGWLDRITRVSSGKRLDRITGSLESGAACGCLYTLL